jgi:hypothetical protein
VNRIAKSAAAGVLLGAAVLAGLVWIRSDGGEGGDSSVGPPGGAAPSRRLESESGKAAGDGATTTDAVREDEVPRRDELSPPPSMAAPEVYQDWISRSSLLTGTPDVATLMRVLDQLAETASTKRTGATNGRISFRDDPNTVGDYSSRSGEDGGSEKIRVVIRTTAPRGSVFEDPRFIGREVQFEFDRSSRSDGFTSQVCLLGRESGRMTARERDQIYGSSPDPIRVGFSVSCSDKETRVDRLTLQIRQEDDGSYLAWLVGGNGADAVFSPSRTCSATLDRWRRTLGL